LRRCQRFEIARARACYCQSIRCQITHRGAVGRFPFTPPSSIFAARRLSSSIYAIATSSSPSCSLVGSFIQPNPAGIRASYEVVGRSPLHL